MTFEELLELNADELERLTDEQLQEYLAPCLKDCPPIDLKVIQDEQDKIKLEKQLKKDADKATKKAEKDKLKLEKLTKDLVEKQKENNAEGKGTDGVSLSGIKVTTPANKAAKIRPMMDMLKVMQEQLAEKIRLQKENKT
jgi:hypothetical protein